MPLTDIKLRALKTPGKHFDGGGLYLEVTAGGGRYWRLKYRFGGREKRLACGVYPEVSLKEARTRREDARRLLAEGTDPGEVKRQMKADSVQQQVTLAREDAGLAPIGSFEAVARDWLKEVHERDVSDGRAMRTRRHLEADVFPHIGHQPVGEITAARLLGVLRSIEARGAAFTAHRIKQTCGQVFRYAITTGHAERDPVPDLRGALAKPVTEHFAAITDPLQVGELLRSIDAYEGQPGTRVALLLAALTFQRPGNLIAMQWGHIDLDAALWTIPAAEMKRSRQAKASGPPHLVPLARQAVQELLKLKPLTGNGPFCFPGLRSRDRHISDVTLNAALRRLGFSSEQMTCHGFRAMARTMMVENLPGIDPQWIEAQLAHGKSGPLGAAYDRSQYIKQRRDMMQSWADYLDRLRVGAQVLPFRTA